MSPIQQSGLGMIETVHQERAAIAHRFAKHTGNRAVPEIPIEERLLALEAQLTARCLAQKVAKIWLMFFASNAISRLRRKLRKSSATEP